MPWLSENNIKNCVSYTWVTLFLDIYSHADNSHSKLWNCTAKSEAGNPWKECLHWVSKVNYFKNVLKHKCLFSHLRLRSTIEKRFQQTYFVDHQDHHKDGQWGLFVYNGISERIADIQGHRHRYFYRLDEMMTHDKLNFLHWNSWSIKRNLVVTNLNWHQIKTR